MMIKVSEMEDYFNWDSKSYLYINEHTDECLKGEDSPYHEIGHQIETTEILSELGITNYLDAETFEKSTYVLNY
jgi:hypothetical protein